MDSATFTTTLNGRKAFTNPQQAAGIGAGLGHQQAQAMLLQQLLALQRQARSYPSLAVSSP
jgi:hypothetical protein